MTTLFEKNMNESEWGGQGAYQPQLGEVTSWAKELILKKIVDPELKELVDKTIDIKKTKQYAGYHYLFKFNVPTTLNKFELEELKNNLNDTEAYRIGSDFQYGWMYRLFRADYVETQENIEFTGKFYKYDEVPTTPLPYN